MTVLADAQAKLVGYLQAWESETNYPDETPFVSDIGSVGRPEGQWVTGWLRGISIESVTPLVSGRDLLKFRDTWDGSGHRGYSHL